MADVVLSSNDGHTVMDAQKIRSLQSGRPRYDHGDRRQILSAEDQDHVRSTRQRCRPPGAIWISQDESWGIATSATKADATAKTGGIAPDDRVTVFDLTSNPPKITQSLSSGLGATQVRVSPTARWP